LGELEPEASMGSNISIPKPVGIMTLDASLPHLGWAGRVAAAWAAAGGAAGGTLVAALLLAGRLHPSGSVTIAMLLAGAGSILGLIHGAVLGYLGRHAGCEVALRPKDRVFAVAGAVGGVGMSIALSAWLALSAVLARTGSVGGWLALLAGGAAVLSIAVLASVLGWRSLDCAYHEWQRHSLGAALLGGTFVVLCASFLLLRPALPGTHFQLSFTGWVAVAALATIWIATPAIVLALRWVPHVRDGHPPGATRTR
jgi:hypothetical protein